MKAYLNHAIAAAGGADRGWSYAYAPHVGDKEGLITSFSGGFATLIHYRIGPPCMKEGAVDLDGGGGGDGTWLQLKSSFLCIFNLEP